MDFLHSRGRFILKPHIHLKSKKHRTNELTQNTYNSPEASLQAGSEVRSIKQIPYPGLHGLVSTQNQNRFFKTL